jgi:hypothetical protein
MRAVPQSAELQPAIFPKKSHMGGTDVKAGVPATVF